MSQDGAPEPEPEGEGGEDVCGEVDSDASGTNSSRVAGQPWDGEGEGTPKKRGSGCELTPDSKRLSTASAASDSEASPGLAAPAAQAAAAGAAPAQVAAAPVDCAAVDSAPAAPAEPELKLDAQGFPVVEDM